MITYAVWILSLTQKIVRFLICFFFCCPKIIICIKNKCLPNYFTSPYFIKWVRTPSPIPLNTSQNFQQASLIVPHWRPIDLCITEVSYYLSLIFTHYIFIYFLPRLLCCVKRLVHWCEKRQQYNCYIKNQVVNIFRTLHITINSHLRWITNIIISINKPI